MSTKLIKYRDGKVITNGTTTIVYGVTEVSPTGKMADSMNKAIKAMNDLFNTNFVTRGVARLAPEDEYVESTGVVVASKKAEKIGCKAVRVNYVKAVATLENLLAVMKDDLNALDSRYDTLNSDAH